MKTDNVVTLRAPREARFNISALAREYGVARPTIRRWLKKGWAPGTPRPETRPPYARTLGEIPESFQQVSTPVQSASMDASAQNVTRDHRDWSRDFAFTVIALGPSLLLVALALSHAMGLR